MTFFDIFSKKKDCPREKTKIVVDFREKNSLVPSELAKLDFEIEFRHLPIADYIMNGIVIERKTISDLKSSIISKRIFSQMLELKQYPVRFLIIEGLTEEEFKKGITGGNHLRGFFISAQKDYQIPILFAKNETETALYISLLSKRKGKKEISLRAKKNFQDKSEQILFILEGFPNIGPVRARALLKKFKSLKNIVNASENELSEVLGKKTLDFINLVS